MPSSHEELGVGRLPPVLQVLQVVEEGEVLKIAVLGQPCMRFGAPITVHSGPEAEESVRRLRCAKPRGPPGLCFGRSHVLPSCADKQAVGVRRQGQLRRAKPAWMSASFPRSFSAGQASTAESSTAAAVGTAAASGEPSAPGRGAQPAWLTVQVLWVGQALYKLQLQCKALLV